jgi:TRAP-type C4-dicarboxylate transport system permease small subunit
MPERPLRSDGDARRRGLRLLRAALVTVALLATGITAWAVDKALRYPDIRLRRPGWLDGSAAFDFSFWVPLLVTVVVGGGLVFYVFWRAYRRLRAGEDLYAGRYDRRESPAREA